jgi:hypothetical protein
MMRLWHPSSGASYQPGKEMHHQQSGPRVLAEIRIVIPAQAGTQGNRQLLHTWVPVCAGMAN